MDLDVLAEDRAPAVSVGQTLELSVVAEFLMLKHVKIGGGGVAAKGRMRAGEDLETQSGVEGWVWEGQDRHTVIRGAGKRAPEGAGLGMGALVEQPFVNASLAEVVPTL